MSVFNPIYEEELKGIRYWIQTYRGDTPKGMDIYNYIGRDKHIEEFYYFQDRQTGDVIMRDIHDIMHPDISGFKPFLWNTKKIQKILDEKENK